VADALHFVHRCKILHNDIKGDNIIISDECGYHPIIIDFGKARKIYDAKRYSLNKSEQEKYFKHHWHIAPELIRGTHKQSIASDVYSYGVLLHYVCKKLNFAALSTSRVSKKCLETNPSDRPKLLEICLQLSVYS